MNVTSIRMNGFQLYNDGPWLPYQIPTPSISRTAVAEFFFQGVDNTQSYIIKGATGLDAEDIVGPNLGYPRQSVRRFSKKPRTRHVSLLISLNPNYANGETIEGLRHALYNSISINPYSNVEFQFMNGTTELAHLTGEIEKFESGSFTSEAQVQITLICDYPFLRSSVGVSGFSAPTFPSSSYSTMSWVDDLSNAPHGYSIVFEAASDQSELSFFSEDGPVNFGITWDFLEGDIVTVSGEFDNKYVEVLRPDPAVSFPHPPDQYFLIASAVDVGSVWPIMWPLVTNSIDLPYYTTAWNMVGLSWYPTYWGI